MPNALSPAARPANKGAHRAGRLHSAWRPAHGAGAEFRHGGVFRAASCPRPLLTLTDAPAPIQALCGAGVLGHRCLALVPSVSIHPFSCPRPSVPPPSGPTLLAKSICPSG